MQVTEEQRRRAEANRLAALQKRSRAAAGLPISVAGGSHWGLSKCRKVTPNSSSDNSILLPAPPPAAGFCVVLEICSASEFSVYPGPADGSPYPGDSECFQIIQSSLSSIAAFHFNESQSGRKSFVYSIEDYELVLRSLKRLKCTQVQEIPFHTRRAIEKLSRCADNSWIPCEPHHLSDDVVDELMKNIPKLLLDALMPFQLEGIRFGLRRGGRCLIADEMGLGKTIQAIAIACCFLNEGRVLVICPAVLRYSWAEELEHWLPILLPKDIHLVFGHQDNINRLDRQPKVVVTSYTMLNRLQRSMLEQEWAVMIVDESHSVRCTKKKSESEETKVVLKLAETVERIILLSGTPSLSRPYDIYHQVNILWPGLLGKDKYEFANNYCSVQVVRGYQGNVFMDFSRGTRLEELNVLLRQSLMIRRLKEHVMAQLPPKRRQIIRLVLSGSDIQQAITSCRIRENNCANWEGTERSHQSEQDGDVGDDKSEDSNSSSDKCDQRKSSKTLSYQEIGIAKLSGFREWLSNHSIFREPDYMAGLDVAPSLQKMIIFAHHLKVLDKVQEFVFEHGIKSVRIDGSTLSKDRQRAVEDFRQSVEVKVAIIGVTAGGVGLDFSAARNVVFLELPKSASEMLQAEDRAHRRGQTNAVNIYIFCAKDTLDESRWCHLNKSLFRVSSVMNGKCDAIKQIEVDCVFHLESCETSPVLRNLDGNSNENWELADTGIDNQTFEASKYETEGIASLNEEHDDSTEVAVNSKYSKAEGQSSLGVNKEDAQYVLVEDGEGSPIRGDMLRFEVSQYTGRIHLYICIPGKDLRPRPLFENFRPEELELGPNLTCRKIKPTFQHVKEDSANNNIFQTFVNDWNSLRPIEQNKLHGKPLQLPLNLELCYLRESLNHGREGLLKGGSKRRVTPLSEISHPLPENAAWKKVTLCSSLGKLKEYTQAWTLADEPLCKLCQTPCMSILAKTPEYFEDLFCTLSCYQEYRIRTSQRSLRDALFQVENGVCTQCKLDCHKLVQCIKRLSIEKRKEYVEKIAPNVANKKKLFERLVYEPIEGNAWHADHILPVYKGGGECRLENMRTLCVACHSEVTAAQRAERRLAKFRAKEHLKKTMKMIESCTKCEIEKPDETGVPSGGGSMSEDLFVKVPGSSYSTGQSEDS